MAVTGAAADRGAPLRLLRRDPAARRWAAASLVSGALAQAAWLGWLLLLAAAIDRAFVGRRGLDELTGLLAAMVALLGARAAGLWLAEVLGARAAQQWVSGLRARTCAALAARDPRRVGGDRVGAVSGVLTTGVASLGTWLTHYAPAAAQAVAVPAMAAAAVLVLDPLSILVLVFAGPMLVLLLAVIGGRTAELTRRRFDELGWLRGFYLDLLAGLGTLRAFGREEDAAEAVEATSRRFGDTTMEVLRTAFQTSLAMEWAATAATALVAVEVGFRLIAGQLSFGTALAVLVLTPEFFVPLRRLAVEYHTGRAGDAAAEALEDLLAAPQSGNGPEGEHGPQGGHGPDVQAEVAAGVTAGEAVPVRSPIRPPRLAFEGVGFRYGGHRALDGLDLVLEPGETVALVGPSGGGKSTVASLLLRFIEAGEGRILVDGTDLRRLDVAQWRRQVAWVPQDPTVFSGTVADNIALGEPGAGRGEVERAAAAAGATAFIDALPQGFDTVLGEGAATLSGGQRQRLAIARAHLRDAPVVILDEFTAHLDARTEAEVLAAASRLLAGRTALLIAHRTATARSADRIAVLEGGRIVESGTDAGLLAAGGAWAGLCAAVPPVGS